MIRAQWTVIHLAKSERAAQAIEAALCAEGFLARVRSVYRTTAAEENYFEIKVPGSEAREAQQFLIERGLL